MIPPAMAMASFNSKLVRLKVPSTVASSNRTSLFQFQTGSIKSNAANTLFEGWTGFNSKLVRLKGCVNVLVVSVNEDKFQFQTGSIKRILVWTAFSCCVSRFNSKLVRLKVRESIAYS